MARVQFFLEQAAPDELARTFAPKASGLRRRRREDPSTQNCFTGTGARPTGRANGATTAGVRLNPYFCQNSHLFRIPDACIPHYRIFKVLSATTAKSTHKM
jgi:hypothetical protein